MRRLAAVMVAVVAACSTGPTFPSSSTPPTRRPSTPAPVDDLRVPRSPNPPRPVLRRPPPVVLIPPAGVERARPTPPPPSRPARARGDVWAALAECESSSRWDLDAAYDGGLQFDPDTWVAYGGGAFAAHAYEATPAEQIAVAERVLADQGWGAWPGCARKLGLI